MINHNIKNVIIKPMRGSGKSIIACNAIDNNTKGLLVTCKHNLNETWAFIPGVEILDFINLISKDEKMPAIGSAYDGDRLSISRTENSIKLSCRRIYGGKSEELFNFEGTNDITIETTTDEDNSPIIISRKLTLLYENKKTVLSTVVGFRDVINITANGSSVAGLHYLHPVQIYNFIESGTKEEELEIIRDGEVVATFLFKIYRLTDGAEEHFTLLTITDSNGLMIGHFSFDDYKFE